MAVKYGYVRRFTLICGVARRYHAMNLVLSSGAACATPWLRQMLVRATPLVKHSSDVLLVAWRSHASNGGFAAPPLGYSVLVVGLRVQK
jgi:hypothetical protein